MQGFPVNNLHCHGQPLFAYLRLLGIEPAPDGALLAGARAGTFRSRSFELREDGSGRLRAEGRVTVRTPQREVTGGPGEVVWPC